MRWMVVAVLAVMVCIGVSDGIAQTPVPAATPPAGLVNGDFSKGEPGALPSGWLVLPLGTHARVVQDDRSASKRAVELGPPASGQENEGVGNILQSFDEFTGSEILAPRTVQDYQSVYLNLYQDFRSQRDAEKESILDEVVFEIELIKQVEINVDYILLLVEQHRSAKGDGKDKEIRAEITRAVTSSPSLRNKRDLILAFIESI